nr:MAG TPA: hypothetical protein [Caudoviricetes sp.]
MDSFLTRTHTTCKKHLHLYNTYIHILRYTLHYYRNLVVYMYFTLFLFRGTTYT